MPLPGAIIDKLRIFATLMA